MVERLKTLMIAALLTALAGSIALAATGGEAEVRINARQLEDGRVEFALQQRVDGEWGERQLPRSRYFPADAAVGRWLNSTPLTVTAAESEAPVARGSYTPQQVELGSNDDTSLIWGTRDSAAGFQTFVAVTGQTNSGTFDEAIVYFICEHDNPDGTVYAQVKTFYASYGGDPTWQTSFDNDRAATWRMGTLYDATAVTGATHGVYDSDVVFEHASLLSIAEAKRWLRVGIPTYADDWSVATFDLDGAFSTPAQRNLENCGS